MKGRPKAAGADKRGTAKKKPSAIAKVAPMPDELAPCLPSAPTDLPDEMALVWDAIMEDLGRRGANPSAGRPIDATVVRTLVDAIQTHQEAVADIREHGIILERPIMSKDGEVVGFRREKNPAVGIQKDAASTILRYTDSLGLNPSARVRLGVMELAGQSILASLQRMMSEAGE